MKNKILKFFIIFSVSIFVILGLGLIVASPYLSAVMRYREKALELAAGSSAEDFCDHQSSIIYDINGQEITSISGAKEMYYVEYEKIPAVVKNAFILTEDRKFFSHNGIDIYAIARSVLANIKSSSIAQGASTITQQLARNIYLTQDVTWERKITEMFLAMELEKLYSKEDIMEFYINNIYYANGYYGIEAAAQGYFSVGINELTLSEIIFLTGIPKNPSKYDPVTNFDAAIERRDYILGLLYEFNCISNEDYMNAVSEEIALTRSKRTKNDYVETYVFYCATRALMEANGFKFCYQFATEEEEAEYNELYDEWYSRYQTSLFTEGYKIYTSIDLEKQELLQQYVNDTLLAFPDTNEEGIYKMQGAAVCIDNATGYVTAIVGGRDQNYPGYTLNRAYQSFRQSGSSIKPLNVYAPFLGLGNNPDYPVDDSPMEGGPVNSNDLYLGQTTVKEALAWSSNVAAWKLYEEITPEYGFSFLRKMNFKKLGNDDDYMAVSLGGFTYGVSAVEMAAGFATLANDGVYREPTTVSKILNSDGKIIVDNTYRATRVYDINSARMISHILQYGVEEGLATGAQVDNAIVAVKTGTTSDNKDGWTVGYSAYYTTAVWVGCDIPESVPVLTGGTFPLYIWRDFMNDIHKGLKKVEFPEYELYSDGTEEETTSTIEEENRTEETRFPGDADSTVTGGDVDAPTGGDTDAALGGDEDAGLKGDEDAMVKGDGDANITGGDNDAQLGGDADGSIQGDRNAPVGGDKDATLGGDTDATIQGDADANLGGDTDLDGDSALSLQGDQDADWLN